MNDLIVEELSNSDVIRSRIFTIRGVQVMLDRDLAELYGVATKVLNQAVKRNIERFPSEFTFLITSDEMIELVTNCDRFKNMKHSVLPLIAQKRKDVEVVVIKNSRNRLLHDVDVAQFNAQSNNSLVA
jgi:hypothetical protein